MRIIVAGGGKIGMTLIKKLSEEGYELTLIDEDSEVIAAADERFDIMTEEGNCASMDVLIKAGVAKADLLIAVTLKDEINLLSCLTAHGLNKNLHTISRVRNPAYRSQIFELRDLYGLSMIVNPERQVAKEIERNLRYPGFLGRDTFAKGVVEIVELKIEPNSLLSNLTPFEIQKKCKANVLVCAVLRNGKLEIPRGDFTILEGDHIYLSGYTDELTKLLKYTGVIISPVKSAMLCGGGSVGYYLAEALLKAGINVTIVEQNPENCIELASRLPKADVINGDASNQFLLEKEGIKNFDALVTLTGMDETNIILSIYGRSLGVGQIITKIGHMENHSLLDEIPMGVIVSPREVCSDNIIQYVRAMENKQGAALTVYSIANGLAEASEFRVDSSTLHKNEKIRDIHLRKNILIVCTIRNGKTEFVNGDSTLIEGDGVIVVAGEDVHLHQLNDIFS